MISPIEISLMAGVALLLFGAERLPKIARSAGEMRREFMRGQTEGETPADGSASPTDVSVSAVHGESLPVTGTKESERHSA